MRDGSTEAIEPEDITTLIRRVVAALEHRVKERSASVSGAGPAIKAEALSMKAGNDQLDRLTALITVGQRQSECVPYVTRAAAQAITWWSQCSTAGRDRPDRMWSRCCALYRGDRARTTNGHGLGLAIVKRHRRGPWATVHYFNAAVVAARGPAQCFPN